MGSMPRLRFCWRPWGLKINLERNILYLLKVEHLFLLSGGARNKRQYPTFLQNQQSFVGCWTANGWITYSWFMGCSDRNVTVSKRWRPTYWSWTKLRYNFGSFQEHKLQGTPVFIRISHRNWCGTIKQRFWMWQRLIGHLLHGRDQHFLKIKWSRGRKQKFASTQIPSYAWEKCQSGRISTNWF